MPESNVRPDAVNVAHIMEQIRARIRERRGVDDSEQQVRDLAAAKLDKLLEQFSRAKAPAAPPSYTFDRDTVFKSASGSVPFLRRLLRPLLRMFINTDQVADALQMQSTLNARQAQIEASRSMLYDELIHNLVIEAARLGLEVKNLRMRVESLASRLEFAERRSRTLESAMITKGAGDEPAAHHVPAPPAFTPPPSPPPYSSSFSSLGGSQPHVSTGGPISQSTGPQQPGPQQSGGPGSSGPHDGQRRRRRRRRRGRRGGGGMGAPGMGGQGVAPGTAPGEHAAAPVNDSAPEPEDAGHDAFQDDGPDEGGEGPDTGTQ